MQYLKDEIRNDILSAALDEFYEKGYRRSSMRNIAKNAGMTVGNLYRYFKNKDEIFMVLVQPVAKAIIDLTENHEKHQLFENGNIQALNQFISSTLMHIHNNRPKELSILINGSQGSNLENFKEDLISGLAQHLREHCYLLDDQCKEDELEPIIYHLIAKNNVEGYILILESDLDQEAKKRAVYQYSNLMINMEVCRHKRE